VTAGVAEGAVRNHVSAVLSKLDLTGRTQAALLALRCGLADNDKS
jgi:DNA-binding NarL/FixJ family response regulator